MAPEPRQAPGLAGGPGIPERIAQLAAPISSVPVLDLLNSAAGQDVQVLRAVLRISHAVLGLNRLEDALEVIAEQSLAVLNAASFSISRWEQQRGVLRTLINVGDLGAEEVRWPEHEEYRLGEYRCISELMHGRSYVNSIDKSGAEADVSLLRQLGKESELAVPVMCGSMMWGELWATGTGGRRFGPNDVRLLEAIGAQVSSAIDRAERLSELSRYAYQDPLTRVANRRALDERLAELADGDVDSVLLIADLDGLKAVNDREGHPAGDALLRGVAGVLCVVASTCPGSLVVRLGGDEFCVLLPAGTLSDAAEFARVASSRIAGELGPSVSLCWGAATRGTEVHTHRELIAAADEALLDAKRVGPGRLRTHATGDRPLPPGGERPREQCKSDDLVLRVVQLLDQRQPPTTVAALELLAYELTRVADAAGWAISGTTDDSLGVCTLRGVVSVLDPGSGLRSVENAPHEVYPLAHYPSTAAALATGGTYVAGVDLDGSDPAELAVLHKFGYHALLGIGLFDGERSYLLEIYSDGDHRELSALATHARVLARYCALDHAGRLRSPRAVDGG